MDFQSKFEEFRVQARELVDRVRDLIHEGNIRRIIIRDERGNTFLEIPVNIAAVGVIAAPLLAALGTLAALVARFTVVVERMKQDPTPEPAAPEPEAAPAAGDPAEPVA
jgi:hypothetical protein